MADKDYEFIPCNTLFGRRDIYTAAEELTPENVLTEINYALGYHFRNVFEEQYLYWYRRGFQPVLNRTKERNTFVLHRVVENHAEEFCTFRNGYLFMEPAFYVSRNTESQEGVNLLNEYLYRSGKQAADNTLADWFHTVGKAALYVQAGDDNEIPFKAYALDPRSAFVVYSMRPGNRPVYGVNIVVDGKEAFIDAYTEDTVFRLKGSYPGLEVTDWKVYETMANSVANVEANTLRHIPIIEYRYNSVNESCFEPAISLLDEINALQSERADAVDQAIQNLAVAVNCEIPDDTTAADIKKAGLLVLSSVGENKADFRIISEELNQDQTQTLVDNLYDQALRICSIPTATRQGRGTYDSTGQAAIFNNGWEQAASCARNTEDLFRESNRHFDEIVVDILRRRNLVDISVTDFKLNFLRNETANVQSKAQAAQTMLAMGLHPELALKKSGLSNDPVSDVKMSEKYLKMIWGDPETGMKGEAEIIESDNNNGEDAMGGSV